MSVKCEICGKETRTTQGLSGHMNFVHGMIKNAITCKKQTKEIDSIESYEKSICVRNRDRLDKLEGDVTAILLNH